MSSSAQLLEPFRLNHDIQLVPGGAGILSSGVGVPDLPMGPGAASTTPTISGNLAVGPTTELEDPPGLYEKVAPPVCLPVCLRLNMYPPINISLVQTLSIPVGSDLDVTVQLTLLDLLLS